MYRIQVPEDFKKPYDDTFLGHDIEHEGILDVSKDHLRRFFKRLYFKDVDVLPERNDIKKLLIVMQGGAGDTLFATPGIKALKEQKPDVEISVATWNMGLSLIKHNPYIDKQLLTISSELSLHYADFDEVIDFSRVIGYRPEAESINAYDIYNEHFETLFNIKVEDKKPNLFLTDEEKIQARNVLIDNGIAATDKVIGIVDHSTNLERSWPYIYSMELAFRLVESGYKVIMLGNHPDLENRRFFSCSSCGHDQYVDIDTNMHIQSILRCKACDEINIITGNNQIPGIMWTMSKTSIREASALISQCDLVVGPDSGLIHIAGALDVPFLGLYGPFHSDLRLRYMPSANVIQSDVKCGPCFTHGFNVFNCPLGGPNAPCMWNIQPDEVYNKSIAILETEGRFLVPSIKNIEDKSSNCPVCDYSNIRQLFRKKDYEYYHCLGCRSIYIHNGPDYGIDRYNERYVELDDQSKEIIDEYFVIKDMEAIHEYLGDDDNKLLELGVGEAYYLSKMKDNGLDVHGIEMSKLDRQRSLSTYDIPLMDVDITKDDINDKYNVIIVRSFLEHFSDQNIVWDKIASALEDDGIVIMSGPSSEILRDWNESEHLNTPLAGQHKIFLSQNGLETLCEKHGLEPKIYEEIYGNRFYFVAKKKTD